MKYVKGFLLFVLGGILGAKAYEHSLGWACAYRTKHPKDDTSIVYENDEMKITCLGSREGPDHKVGLATIVYK